MKITLKIETMYYLKKTYIMEYVLQVKKNKKSLVEKIIFRRLYQKQIVEN